jgi:hypothetical protein
VELRPWPVKTKMNDFTILTLYQRWKRHMQNGLLIVSLFIFFGCASSFTTVRQHPEFKVRSSTASTAMLVPPDVVVIRGSSQSTGTKLPDEEAKAAKDLGVLVSEELTHRGFEVKSCRGQDTATDATNDDPSHTTPVQRMYEQLTLAMYGHEPMREPQALAYRYSLGLEAATFAKQAGAGSLVFVRLRMFKRSGADNASETGQKLLVGLLTAGLYVPPKNPSGWVALQIALVDGATGDVLWGNQVSDTSFKPFGEPAFMDNLKEMVADLFKPFPQ